MAARDLIGRTLDYLRSRKRAYQLWFSSPAGNEVLVDLVRFCRATQSTWSDDARHHARLEGRREVILRIAQHMNLTVEQLFSLYNGQTVLQPEKGEADVD